MTRVANLLTLLCALAASVDAVKLTSLPSQLPAPAKAMKKAIQANVAKHAPHGSKLLEQAPSPLVAQLQTKLAVGLSKLPFAHTLVVPDTDANPPVYRRALQQDMQLGGMFGAVGDECKAILSAVGMDAAQMDNDAYDPQLPAHLQQCEGVLSMAMGDSDSDSGNVQADIGFCSAGCKEDALNFLTGFGTVCGADITNFLVEAIKTLPETTEEEQMMKAFSMFAPMMMMSQFAALAKTSVVMEMACTGPSENEFCWSKEWFFDAAMDSDSNDEGDDDSNDDCSYPPSASEACASLPTDDAFCSAPELSDCCATTAMVALNTGTLTSMCPFMSVMENMMAAMGNEEPMPCAGATAAICKDAASISTLANGVAELFGSCCTPAKPGLCAGAPDEMGAASTSGGNTSVPAPPDAAGAASTSGGNTVTTPSVLLAVLASAAAGLAL